MASSLENNQFIFRLAYLADIQRRNEGAQFPGCRKVLTMSQVLSSTADLLPKDLRFKHGGAKLVSSHSTI